MSTDLRQTKNPSVDDLTAAFLAEQIKSGTQDQKAQEDALESALHLKRPPSKKRRSGSRYWRKTPRTGTPLLRAYLGDTIVFRLLHVMMNESHTWHVAGHAFRTERYAENSDFRNAYHVGIAERYDLVTKAGGPQQMAGDYLHL